MKKLFLILAAAAVLCSTAASETFVVSRNGVEVSSTRDGKTWEGIVTMHEAWEGFYGKVDSGRITINPAAFKSNGDGRAFYTVKISASYQGESAESEDQVTMEQDENGNWFVAELPM